MAEHLYNRTNHIIRDANTGATVFSGTRGGLPSINAAKRHSRKLQAANSGLGKGSLQVVS